MKTCVGELKGGEISVGFGERKAMKFDERINWRKKSTFMKIIF